MKSKYAMSEGQVEALAAEYGTAASETSRVGMTYLRVLVAGCQAIIGASKRGRFSPSAQTQALNEVSTGYYAAVLRGITTPELAPAEGLDKAEATRRSLERNRRSTFARSAKSTLVSYIGAGGDLRGLEVDTVTRDPLLIFVRETRGTTEAEHKLERYKAAIIRLITKEARGDPAAARADLEHTIEALQFALDALEGPADKRDKAPKDKGTMTMTGVMHSRPAHARMKAPQMTQGRAHA
jgi:hypothetical protein